MPLILLTVQLLKAQLLAQPLKAQPANDQSVNVLPTHQTFLIYSLPYSL
ncbi:MAG: hypothetical protein WBA01_13430 [Phormidesmis sp.]